MRIQRRFYLMVACLALASNCALGATPQQSLAYEDAQVLGKCAGMLEFTSQAQMVSGNEATANDLHQKANGWRIATMGALQEAGWKDENLVSTADGIYEGAMTGWAAMLERQDPNVGSALQAQTKLCLEYDSKHEYYRMLIKLDRLTKDGSP